MISLVPKAGTFSSRVLNSLGKVLGLRSETVYSRAILLLALFQFIVLGVAVVLVWLSVTDKFERAEERDLLSAAERTRNIRLGTGVVSLAYHNPLMVAERINYLDHIGVLLAMPGPNLTQGPVRPSLPRDRRSTLSNNKDL